MDNALGVRPMLPPEISVPVCEVVLVNPGGKMRGYPGNTFERDRSFGIDEARRVGGCVRLCVRQTSWMCGARSDRRRRCSAQLAGSRSGEGGVGEFCR